ncbi:alpha/beta fold hydrolase [Bacillus sp. JJ722]|uniref:alpha/beta fold hydrolase n=1 Tax=Bacillus sp. JJ722 TaxID=3122973 RepID=UPI002FFE8D22
MKNKMSLNGKIISFIDNGDLTSPVVLLVHGYPETSLIWKELIPTIVSHGYRAIAPDLPGFGQSERFESESTWENYQQFLGDFLEELQVDQVHLFGHDWGSIISLAWAGNHPEKILSLFASDTIFSPDAEWHKPAQVYQTLGEGEKIMEKFGERQYYEQVLKNAIPGITDELLDDFYCVFKTAEGRKVPLELYRSGENLNKIERGKLFAIKKPATIVWGENDPYVPVSYAHQIRDQQLPHASIHVIPNVLHFILFEAVDQVKEIIEIHLQKVKNHETNIEMNYVE